MEAGTLRFSKLAGYLLTIGGGLLWAIGGSCGQHLMQENGVTSNWLVPIRLLVSGLILLLVETSTSQGVMDVWRNPKDARHLIFFSLFGAGASQYFYYTCIQYSNAAFATVISYIFPVLILFHGMLRQHRQPKLYELASIALVMLGTFTCATNWNLSALSVSSIALLVGLINAVTTAYNTVKPQRLIKKYHLLSIMGWGMSISGFVLFLICRPWTVNVQVNGQLFLFLAVVILGGTLFAFCFYQAGVRIIGSLAGSILASVEPVGAVVISVLFLNVSFTLADFLGFILILITIPIIALGQRNDTIYEQKKLTDCSGKQKLSSP